MSHKSITEARTGIEFDRTLEQQGCQLMRQNGSHRIRKLPNGDQMITPAHPKELGKGLRMKLVKIALAAGITVLLAGLVIMSLPVAL